MPAQFSWVDQRLVRDRHLDQLDVHAAALYLFLVTVADVRGLSWYGDVQTARRLSIDEARLRQARDDLLYAGLLAYAKPLYQVLALSDRLPLTASARHVIAPTAPSVLVVPMTDRANMQKHLTALHAALRRRA